MKVFVVLKTDAFFKTTTLVGVYSSYEAATRIAEENTDRYNDSEVIEEELKTESQTKLKATPKS